MSGIGDRHDSVLTRKASAERSRYVLGQPDSRSTTPSYVAGDGIKFKRDSRRNISNSSLPSSGMSISNQTQLLPGVSGEPKASLFKTKETKSRNFTAKR